MQRIRIESYSKMSDSEDIPKNKLQYDEPNSNRESVISKLYKYTMRSRRSYTIVLTLLLIIFAVLIVAVIGLSYVCLTKGNRSHKLCTTEDCIRSGLTKGNRSHELCTTEDCLRSATMIVESMNKSVDPCDDFYQFACGNFGKAHRIPKSSILTDRFIEVYSDMQTLIREFLEKEDDKNEPISVSKSRTLYRSCMDLGAIDKNGLEPLFNTLELIGLPIIGVNNSTSKIPKNLSEILARVKKIINYDILFITSVESDPKNRTANRIALAKPNDVNLFPVHKITEEIRKSSLRKMREADGENAELEKNPLFTSYTQFFENVLVEIINSSMDNATLGLNEHDLKVLVLKMLTYTEELTQIKNNVYDSDHGLPLIMTVNELQKFTDNITRNATKTNERIIDWKQYLTILFSNVQNVTLDFETDLIQVYNIEYFEDLLQILDQVHVTNSILHLWWEVVSYIMPYTTNRMRFFQDIYYYETTGLENNPSRSDHCAESVNSIMGMAVAHVLVGSESINRNIQMLLEMMDNIHWAFKKLVTELSWMDEQTKQKTMYKAQLMKTLVGFPEFVKDPKQLDEYYGNFEVTEQNYFGNVIAYVQRQLNITLMSLRQPNNFTTDTWASDPLDVNAYNWIQANAITIPAGILHFPFFGHDLQTLNYGSLGTILGHELTHGFDNTGRKFDEGGNEHMWWTNRTIQEYEKRSDCFVHHYGSYLIPGLEEKVNGKHTLDENIADNGGLREALWAYRKFVMDHGEEPKLPGLDEFNNEQIYYLSFANSWCQVIKEGAIQNSRLSLDEHSPNPVRVVAGLTNSEEFSHVWKCEKGTKMNPNNNKCKIW